MKNERLIVSSPNKSKLTVVLDQGQLTEEQVSKLATLINRKVGVLAVKIERNLIG